MATVSVILIEIYLIHNLHSRSRNSTTRNITRVSRNFQHAVMYAIKRSRGVRVPAISIVPCALRRKRLIYCSILRIVIVPTTVRIKYQQERRSVIIMTWRRSLRRLPITWMPVRICRREVYLILIRILQASSVRYS